MKSVVFILMFELILSHKCLVEAHAEVLGDADSVEVYSLQVDLSRVLRRVNERYLSVAIDASLVAEEKFMYLLGSPKLRTLAKALAPAFLRFGGTRQDFMVFNPEKALLRAHGTHQQNSTDDTGDACEKLELPPLLEERLKSEWIQLQGELLKEERRRQYRSVQFTEYAVDLLYSFANCSGFDLIFGLNALLRTAGNVWNSSNARTLLQYCEARQYRMAWELGNEPNSYEKKAGIRVNGYQLGLDFIKLKEILKESKLYQNAGLYGPDVSQPSDHRRDLLEAFLQSGAEVIDACTWHHYYVNGRDTSLEAFLDPETLDTLALKTHEVLETIRLEAPGKTVWLGETASAFGGGALGLSDAFVAGFMWMDKLGLGARMGLDVVIRQVLIGSGSYHLLDDNLDPLPDYWLSLLYKRLVGPEVLNIKVLSLWGLKKRVRIYLHCTNRKSTSYKRGAVTLMAINMSKSPARVSVPVLAANTSAVAFILQPDPPGPEGLYSRYVTLNGKLLQMVDDITLPELRGTWLPSEDRLHLPGYSLSFFVIPEAGAPAC